MVGLIHTILDGALERSRCDCLVLLCVAFAGSISVATKCATAGTLGWQKPYQKAPIDRMIRMRPALSCAWEARCARPSWIALAAATERRTCIGRSPLGSWCGAGAIAQAACTAGRRARRSTPARLRASPKLAAKAKLSTANLPRELTSHSRVVLEAQPVGW